MGDLAGFGAHNAETAADLLYGFFEYWRARPPARLSAPKRALRLGQSARSPARAAASMARDYSRPRTRIPDPVTLHPLPSTLNPEP